MVNKTFQGIINDEDELENSASDVLSDEETDQDTEPPDSDDDIDIEDEDDLGMVDSTETNEKETIGSELFGDDASFYDSDEDDEYFNKLTDNEIKVELLNEHPEFKIHNTSEVNALSNVIKDADGNIIDELHRTIPFITRYEKAKILGERAKQLTYSNVEPLIDIPSDIIDSYEIAKLEYNANAIPFIIKRNIPDGSCEYWKFRDLEKILFE